MLYDLGINLLSDIVFIIIGVVIFWLYYLASNRRKLIEFFGITTSKKITIYLSNLNINRGGSTGVDGTRYSFQGTAVAYEESKAATRLQSLFNYFLPSQVDKPEILSKLLIADIDVKVVASPVEENAIERTATIISLGLPPYSAVSRNIERSCNLSAKFDYIQHPTVVDPQNNENLSTSGHRVTLSGYVLGTASPVNVETNGVEASGSTVPLDEPVAFTTSLPYSFGGVRSSFQPIIAIPNIPPYTDTSIGFVQRIFDADNKRNIFYVAGLSENSTAGSAYFLVGNWQKLFKKYGKENSFLVLLKIDNNNNKLFDIVLEK